MGFFDLGGLAKKLTGGGADADKPTAAESRDPRKAARFFEHAATATDAGNYDFAIELYINGLRHAPDKMEMHENLREVALKRKLAGGKPAGFGAMFSGGSNKLEKMLAAEKTWAMSPLDANLMRDFMKAAVAADQQEDEDTNLANVAYWIGVNAMENTNTKPNKSLYLSLVDSFAAIDAYDRAVEACKRAIAVAPNDSKLFEKLKNLEAERMITSGTFGAGGEGDFRANLKDSDAQNTQQAEQSLRMEESELEQLIGQRRAEYDENPEDTDRLTKLIDTLLRTDEEQYENEAIELLTEAWEEHGQYRYKLRAGDIRIKQFVRQSRALKKAAEDKSPEAIAAFQQHQKERLSFELAEFQERVKNYPTDMGLRYELGRRLFQAGQHDEAIGAFQQAKGDAKHRAQAHLYLGQCYLKKTWFEEAIDTLREGIEAHKLQDDRLAMDLRYLLMDALVHQAQDNKNIEASREAQKIASGILQTDINYRDIQQRMDTIRALTKSLEANA
ncbi:tetratricopeptide repeat protein [Mucisphaera calidilacus]|uniref:Tetratricopeptide repeat protein n=1 Tax=Mucisphaera calidilacus TaxID=2527982 RepID=A0A518BY85_9BACT|nr:tetratricopeptide repeat protein [Mucisphaera calidilacus]QDU71939.1 Tetratricopeptide repeat protein [Mucisphaera calidilacus]